MHNLANQKRFIGLTVSGLATIVSLGMLRNGVALGDKPSNDIFVYTGDQLATFQNTTLTESNNVRANRVNPTTKQPIPPLTLGEPQGATLDPTLTNGAQLWAEYLAKKNKGLEHTKNSSKDRDKNAGENIFSYSTSVSPLTQPLAPDFLAKQAISFIDPKDNSGGFASEEANYDYATGKSNGNGEIGHFTQLVWAATTNFSCGAAAATTADKDGFYNYYVVCQYYPAGNVNNQYLNNVFPKTP